jgi:hypothetical protein
MVGISLTAECPRGRPFISKMRDSSQAAQDGLSLKADTIYELEAIEARLIRAGANILRIAPIMIVAEEPPDPPKHAA